MGQSMRENPEKMLTWIQKQEKESGTEEDISTKSATEIWEELKAQIQEGLKQNFPPRQTKQDTPDWAKEAKKWSTAQEWEELQEHITTRKKLQSTITRLDRRTKET